jgi:hypothetical protein
MVKQFVCKYCSKPFKRQVYPSRDHFDFCSGSCRNKARALKPIPCPVCGTMFSPQRINGADGERKRYCSSKCASFMLRGKPSTNPYKHSKENEEFVRKHYPEMGSAWIAEKLGTTKSAITNLANRLGVVLDKAVYRSRVHGAARVNMLGKKNPNWQGGKTCLEWGDNWKVQQRKARQRDNYSCQICGHQSKHITVHHIKPRRFFLGHMEDANVLSNLICLCDKHHVPVEMGKIPCPKPRA